MYKSKPDLINKLKLSPTLKYGKYLPSRLGSLLGKEIGPSLFRRFDRKLYTHLQNVMIDYAGNMDCY